MSTNEFDGQYYEVATPGSLSEKLVAVARERIYADFLRLCAPERVRTLFSTSVCRTLSATPRTSLSAATLRRTKSPLPAWDRGARSRFRFHKIQYRQIVANEALPFADCSFDVVTANAVLEHVGSVENQRFFVSELMRVGRRVYITVPHRFFPVEHHTAIPFLHWFDATFPLACRALRKDKWADSENLILMSRRQLKDASPKDRGIEIGMTGVIIRPMQLQPLPIRARSAVLSISSRRSVRA